MKKILNKAENFADIMIERILVALSSYRAPGAAFQIANDRAEPFHLQCAHYTRADLSSKLNSWITPEYAVYSQYEVNNDLGSSDHMSFELDRWGVKWTDANSGRYSHFAVRHPHPKNGGDHMGGTVYEQMLHEAGHNDTEKIRGKLGF